MDKQRLCDKKYYYELEQSPGKKKKKNDTENVLIKLLE